MKRIGILLAVLLLFSAALGEELLTAGEYEYLLLPDGSASVTAYLGEEDGALTVPADLNGVPVTRVADYAFAYCLAEEILLPEGVTEIGAMAFNACYALKRIGLPQSLRVIGPDAFLCCEALEEVLLPEGLERIGEEAFFNCASLRIPEIPVSVTEVGHWAFEGCGGVWTEGKIK